MLVFREYNPSRIIFKVRKRVNVLDCHIVKENIVIWRRCGIDLLRGEFWDKQNGKEVKEICVSYVGPFVVVDEAANRRGLVREEDLDVASRSSVGRHLLSGRQNRKTARHSREASKE